MSEEFGAKIRLEADPSSESSFRESIQAIANKCKATVTIDDVVFSQSAQNKVQAAINNAANKTTATINNVKIGKVDASSAVTSVKSQLSSGLNSVDLSKSIKIDSSAFAGVESSIRDIRDALLGVKTAENEFSGKPSFLTSIYDSSVETCTAISDLKKELYEIRDTLDFGNLKKVVNVLDDFKTALGRIDGPFIRENGIVGYFDEFTTSLKAANGYLETMRELLGSINEKPFSAYSSGGLTYSEGLSLESAAKNIKAIAEKMQAVKSTLGDVSGTSSGEGMDAVADSGANALRTLTEVRDALVGIRDALLGVGDQTGVFAQMSSSMNGLITNTQILVTLLDTVKNSKFESAKSAAAASLKYSGLKEAKEEALAYYNTISQLYQDLVSLPNYVTGKAKNAVYAAFGGENGADGRSAYSQLVKEFAYFAEAQDKASGIFNKINSAKTTQSLDGYIYQLSETYTRLRALVESVNSSLGGVGGVPTIVIDDSQLIKTSANAEKVAAALGDLATAANTTESEANPSGVLSLSENLNLVREAIVGIRDALLGVDNQQGVFVTLKSSMDELLGTAKELAEQFRTIKAINVDGGKKQEQGGGGKKSGKGSGKDGAFSQIRAEYSEFAKAYKTVLSKESTQLSSKNLGDEAVARLEALKQKYVDISDAITNLSKLSGDERTQEITRISQEIAKANEEVAVMRQLAEAKQKANRQAANSSPTDIGSLTDRVKVLTTAYKAIEKQEGSTLSSSVLGDDAVQKLQQIRDGYKEIKTAMDALSGLSGDARTQEIIRINELVDSINAEMSAYDGLTKSKKEAEAQTKRNNQSEQKAQSDAEAHAKAVQKLKAELETYRSMLTSAEGNQKETVSGYLNELTNGVTSSRLKEMQREFTNMREAGVTAGTTIGAKFKQLATVFASFAGVTKIFYTVWNMVKKAVTNVKEIDSAMTQLKIVTGATDNTMSQFLTNAISLSKELGTSVTEVLSSIETFARLGYNIEDATHLSEYATILANVGAVDVSEATTGLTSIIKGYGMATNEAEHVSDVLIEVGQKYAISAGELMEGFERAGAALSSSGTSFEKSAALLAAGNAAIQNAESVGTALKTISARIRGATTELTDMGEATDDVAQGFSKYRDELLSLTGFDIMENLETGDYKDMYDIFVGISEKWDDLSETTQARVSEILGGTRQLSIISSILTNISDATGSYEAAMDSAGVATKSNEIYMDSIEGRMGSLSASFQEMSTNLLDSSTAKGILDIADSLLAVADSLAKVNALLPSVLAMILSFKNVGVFSVDKNAQKGQRLQVGGISAGNLLTSQYSWKSIFDNTVNVDAIKKYNEVFADAEKACADITDEVTRAQNAQVAAFSATTQEYGKLNQATFTLIRSAGNAQVSADALSGALNSQKTSTLGAQIASAAFNTALTMLVSVGINLLIKGISSAINHTENLIKAGQAARETVESITTEFESNASTIESASKSYIKYMQDINQATWGNESLSTDDYNEFLSIANQIGEILPEHVRYFDAEGNAVLDLAGDTDTLTNSLKDLVAQMREAANVEIAEQLDDIFKGSTAQSGQYENEINHWNYILSALQEGEFYNDFENAEFLTKYGIGYSLGGSGLSAGQILEIDISKYGKQIENATKQVESEIKRLEGKISSEYSSLGKYLYSWLSTDGEFVMLAEDVQNALQEVIYNVNWNDLNIKDADAAKTWITSNLIDGLAEAEAVMDSYQGVLDIRTLFQTGDASYASYKEAIDGLWDALEASTLSNDAKQQIGLVFGKLFNVENIEPQVKKIGDVLRDEVDGYVEELSKEDIELGYEIVANTDDGGMSVEEFEAKIDELRNTKVVASFSIKDYENDIDNIQSDLKTLRSSLENIESGDIEADDLIDLIQDFPSLLDSLDSSEEGFSSLTVAIKRLIKSKGDKFIETMTEKMNAFRQSGDEAGAKGIENLIKLMEELSDTSKTSLGGIIDQFGNYKDAIDSAAKAYQDFKDLIEASDYQEGYQNRYSAYKEMRELFNNGNGWGVEALRPYMDYLGIEGSSKQDIKDFISTYGGLYTDSEEFDFGGASKFFQMLQKIKGDVNGLVAENGADGWAFEYDSNEISNYVAALNKEFEGINFTDEMFTDFVELIHALSDEWETTTLADYMKQFEGQTITVETNLSGKSASEQLGQFGKGNIDLYDRPRYINPDGSISTVSSASFNINGREVLLPSVWRNEAGNPYKARSDEEILKHYEETGEYLGIFDTVEAANAYAQLLHSAQEYYYAVEDGNKSASETYADLDKFISETNGYYGKTRDEIEAAFSEAGLEMPYFVDTEAVKNAADVAESGKEMYWALQDAGISAETMQEALSTGDFSNIEAIADGLGLGETYAEKIVRLLQGAYLDNLGVEELQTQLASIEELWPSIQESIDAGDYEGLQTLLEEFGYAKENAEGIAEALQSINPGSDGAARQTGGAEEFSEKSGGGGQFVTVNYVVEGAETLTEPIDEAREYANTNPVILRIKTDAEDGSLDNTLESIDTIKGGLDAVSQTEAAPSVKLAGANTVISLIEKIKARIKEIQKDITLSINAKVNSGSAVIKGKNSSGVRHEANAKGTANFSGGTTLLGDQYSADGSPRPELVVDNGEAFIAGLEGPEFQTLGKGAVVYTYDETKKILKNGSLRGKIPAFSAGKGQGSFPGGGGTVAATAKTTAVTTASTYEDVQKELEHLLNMHLISYQEYYTELAALEKKYYSEIHADNETLWQYQESVFNAAEQAFDDIVNAATHSATIAQSKFSEAARAFDYSAMYATMTKQLNAQQQIMDAVEQRIKELADTGVDENDSAMRELREQWQSAYDSFVDISESIENEIRSIYSEALDGVQDVYNALIEASDEFAQNGYISVDTFQTLCDLGVQYIKYLRDENGAITFDEEAIQKLIQAKVQDMAVTQANLLVDSIEAYIAEGKALETLAYTTDAAATSTWSLVYARLASLNLSDDLYEAFSNQIKALQALSISAQQSVMYTRESASEVAQEQKEYLDDLLDLTKELIKHEVEDQIEALDDQKDAMQDLIEQRKKMIELQKDNVDYEQKLSDYTKRIAEIQFKINQLSLDDSREAQAERAELIEQLRELQGEAADYMGDQWREKTEEALDDQYDVYEENIDKQKKALEESIASEEKLYQLAIARISQNFDTLYQDLINYNTAYGNQLNDTIIKIWENASKAVREYGGYVEAILALQDKIDGRGTNVIGNSSGKALTEEDRSIIAQMKANSRQWYIVETDEERNALTQANANLASQLSQRYALNPTTGLWTNDYGEALYTRDSWYDDSLIIELVSQMKRNAAEWNGASASRRQELADWNARLAQYVQSFTGERVNRDSNGVWWIGNEELFRRYHNGGIVSADKLKGDEVVGVLRKGEMVLTDEMQTNLGNMIDMTSYFMEKANELSGLMNKHAGMELAETLFKSVTPSASSVENSQSINLVINVNVSGNLSDNNYNDFADRISRQVSEKMSDAFYRKGIKNSTARAILRG